MTTQNDEFDLVYNPDGKPSRRHYIIDGGMFPHRISPIPDDGLGMLETLLQVLKVPRDSGGRLQSTVTPSKYQPEYFNRNLPLSKNKLYEAIASDTMDKGDNHV